MIISSEQLLFENSAYANPQCRVQTLVKKGALIPLKRGLFETEANTPGFILANALLGPSYLSFEYALSYYGMIPERVMTYTSATFGKNKKIEYKRGFGRMCG
jgi:predicted transcriptional regulator of viral defense system